MQEKKSRRGKIFYSCSRYPECKFALWNPPVEEPCPQCDFPLLTRKVTKRKGPHLVCHKKECDYERILPDEAEGDGESGAAESASA
jgi:DNA topoisomerase-1